LTVEYTNRPVGVDIERPRLSWCFDATPGNRQTAYRIIVASTPTALENEDCDRWDSGKVNSEQSIQVPYDGPVLDPGEHVYWKVRAWDGDDEPGPWSEVAEWEQGLGSEDWSAEWIGAPFGSNRERIQNHERAWADYTVEVEAETSGPFGIVVRARDSQNCVMARVDAEFETLRFSRRENGGWTTIREEPIDPPNGETIRARVTVEGNTIKAQFGRNPVYESEIAVTEAGRPGLYVPAASTAVVSEFLAKSDDDEYIYQESFDDPPTDPVWTDGTIDGGRLVLNDAGVALLQVFRPYVAPAPQFRREFELDDDIDRARAYICGLGLYDLEVNGARVGDRVLDPGQTNYEGQVLYATHDVTEQLQEGGNAIGVTLGRGRFGEAPPAVVHWHRAPWWSDPKLCLQLEITLTNGDTRTITTGPEWTVTDGALRFDSLFYGECFDARRDPGDWQSPDYDDSEWEAVELVAGPDGDRRSQHVQPIAETAEITPVSVERLESQGFIFDFGKQIVGWPALTVEGSRGDDLRIQAGEYTTEDGVFARTPYRDAEIQENTIILDGDGQERWSPRFTYHGFRYIQIEGSGVPTDPDDLELTATAIHTPVEANDTSSVATDNEVFQQLHDNCRQALLNNLHSIPTDTPVYEKRGWTGDAQLIAETGIYNFDMSRFNQKRLEDLKAEVETKGGGFVPTVVPCPNPDLYATNSDRPLVLGWQSEYPLLVWWMYRYYGDERVLSEHYDHLRDFLSFVDRHTDDDHLVRDGLGDWLPPHTDTPHPPEGPAIVGSAYYYRCLQVVTAIAECLGHAKDAQRYRKLAEDLETAFNDEFLDHSAGLYRTGETVEYRQTSNLLPLAFDMVPSDYEATVEANLVADITDANDGHLNVGVFGAKFLLQELSERDHHELAVAIAETTTYPGWGFMLRHGASALWEGWNPDSRSLDHHFLGTIDEWFYQYLAGIREPLAPGFRQIRIAPRVGAGITWCEGRVETVRGTIESRWEVGAEGLNLAVEIPGNTTGRVELPTLEWGGVDVVEGSNQIWSTGEAVRPLPSSISDITRTNERVVVEVEAGTFEFVVAPHQE
jgi:alpha-L-rhamnosidase